MESEDIYGNLDNIDLGADIEKLHDHNHLLQEHIASLELDVEKLCGKITDMKSMQNNLQRNISELFKTAKAEIERKDRTISELRTQLDDYLFKRQKAPFKRARDNVTLSSETEVTNHFNKKPRVEQQHGRRASPSTSDFQRERRRSRSRSRDRAGRRDHNSYKQRRGFEPRNASNRPKTISPDPKTPNPKIHQLRDHNYAKMKIKSTINVKKSRKARSPRRRSKKVAKKKAPHLERSVTGEKSEQDVQKIQSETISGKLDDRALSQSPIVLIKRSKSAADLVAAAKVRTPPAENRRQTLELKILNYENQEKLRRKSVESKELGDGKKQDVKSSGESLEPIETLESLKIKAEQLYRKSVGAKEDVKTKTPELKPQQTKPKSDNPCDEPPQPNYESLETIDKNELKTTITKTKSKSPKRSPEKLPKAKRLRSKSVGAKAFNEEKEQEAAKPVVKNPKPLIKRRKTVGGRKVIAELLQNEDIKETAQSKPKTTPTRRSNSNRRIPTEASSRVLRSEKRKKLEPEIQTEKNILNSTLEKKDNKEPTDLEETNTENSSTKSSSTDSKIETKKNKRVRKLSSSSCDTKMSFPATPTLELELNLSHDGEIPLLHLPEDSHINLNDPTKCICNDNNNKNWENNIPATTSTPIFSKSSKALSTDDLSKSSFEQSKGPSALSPKKQSTSFIVVNNLSSNMQFTCNTSRRRKRQIIMTEII